jgi:hypothetical protein
LFFKWTSLNKTFSMWSDLRPFQFFQLNPVVTVSKFTFSVFGDFNRFCHEKALLLTAEFQKVRKKEFQTNKLLLAVPRVSLSIWGRERRFIQLFDFWNCLTEKQNQNSWEWERKMLSESEEEIVKKRSKS